ncbi:Uncharacterized conserved protein, DUF2147 family [Chryseobacterium soldanellicola]|uniref:Uncharacterized conserved protein, DUF2147 family n=1 Tax=Chryseobacterium soldanellicola TaxID=311333 RepID=A0A1H1FUQ9_9FLAO|nr:DUF2147 domain-containing protein [Chryseobacterium soldanellicola]SDR04459.1 Uncharacterized conserved protein, DUF2147 family [Chryseobacterium soldanellicola]
MKNLLFTVVMLLVTVTTFAQKLSADKIIGVWESVDSDPKLKFEFYKSDGKYFGKLLYASNMYEADGKTIKKDDKNPDKSLRGRSRYGITNITDLTYQDGEYTGGNLYNPAEGSNYRVKAKLKNGDEMDFRGYVGISLLGKTMKFKRVK